MYWRNSLLWIAYMLVTAFLYDILCLGNIFSSDTGFGSPNVKKLLEETAANGFGDVHPFTVHELKQVLRQMRKNRCADSNDVLAEYFIFGSDELHQRLVTIYNDMIQSGCLEESWRNTMFTMLPKSGDLQQPSNWRPIAILEITYIFFCKIGVQTSETYFGQRAVQRPGRISAWFWRERCFCHL